MVSRKINTAAEAEAEAEHSNKKVNKIMAAVRLLRKVSNITTSGNLLLCCVSI